MILHRRVQQLLHKAAQDPEALAADPARWQAFLELLNGLVGGLDDQLRRLHRQLRFEERRGEELETELSELHHLFESVLGGLDVALIVVDESGRIINLNPCAERWLEVDFEQALGRDWSGFFTLPSPPAPGRWQHPAQSRAGRAGALTCQPMLSPGGRRQYLLCFAEPDGASLGEVTLAETSSELLPAVYAASDEVSGRGPRRVEAQLLASDRGRPAELAKESGASQPEHDQGEVRPAEVAKDSGADQPERDRGEPRPTEPAKGSAGLRVLVAEDEMVARTVASELIAGLGHQCSVAEDGQEALDLYDAQGADVLLLDWFMPHLTGPEVAATVRRRAGGSRPYLIVMTATSDEERQQEALAAGVDTMITKPLDIGELIGLLETARSELEKRGEPPAQNEVNWIDRERIMRHCQHDVEAMERVITRFLGYYQGQVALLRQGLEKGDIAVARPAVQSLRSSLSYFGATELITRLTYFEDALSQENLEVAETRLERFVRGVDRMIEQLEALRREVG